MCRAVKVLCVAPDAARLQELKMASVGAAWELSPGATTDADALEQLDGGRAHILVALQPTEALLRDARAKYPALRIIADTSMNEVDVVFSDLAEVRAAIVAVPSPSGPVRTAGDDSA